MSYELKFFGVKVKFREDPPGWLLLLFFPAAAVVWYLISALILFAFIQLFGTLLFSWLNVLWFAILLGALRWLVGSGEN